jgi:hypothetical protein
VAPLAAPDGAPVRPRAAPCLALEAAHAWPPACPLLPRPGMPLRGSPAAFPAQPLVCAPARSRAPPLGPGGGPLPGPSPVAPALYLAWLRAPRVTRVASAASCVPGTASRAPGTCNVIPRVLPHTRGD